MKIEPVSINSMRCSVNDILKEHNNAEIINVRNLTLNPLQHTVVCETGWAIDAFAVNSSFLSVDGITCHTIWKLKKRSIKWYIIHIDCIDF